MEKMKLNIQLFAEEQILDESRGDSDPAIDYKVWADVTDKTFTTVANIKPVVKRTDRDSVEPINTTMSKALAIPISQLPINFNGSEGITAINFNGNNVEHLYFNGTQIF